MVHIKTKRVIWIFGCTIYLAMMAEGFLGYVLPYGQMSYWGAQVITSLFGAIPYVESNLELWVRGDYYIWYNCIKIFCFTCCCTSSDFDRISISSFSCFT